jgi:choline dehydrogenase-like flavoprotein
MASERYTIAIVGAGPGGLSAAARAAETGTSHVLLEAAPHLSNTIYRYQKGKHVMAEPGQLCRLRSPLGFEAGTREAHPRRLGRRGWKSLRCQRAPRCRSGGDQEGWSRLSFA